MRTSIALLAASVPILASAQSGSSLPALKEELAAEVASRAAADRDLGTSISAEGTARANAVTAEATARSTGDAALMSAISAEAAARGAGITAEASRASTAENGLQQALAALQAQVTELQARVGSPGSGGAAAPSRFTVVVECGSTDFSGSCQAWAGGLPNGKVFVVESAMSTILGTDSTQAPRMFLLADNVTALPIRCETTLAPTTTCTEPSVKINLKGNVGMIAEWGGRIYARIHLFGYLQAALVE